MMKQVLYFFALTAIAASLSPAQLTPIRLDILIHDQSGFKDTVTWGLDASATDSIDASLGEIQRPPTPPDPGFDIRWINRPGSTKLGKRLILDLRDFVTHVQAHTYRV